VLRELVLLLLPPHPRPARRCGCGAAAPPRIACLGEGGGNLPACRRLTQRHQQLVPVARRGGEVCGGFANRVLGVDVAARTQQELHRSDLARMAGVVQSYTAHTTPPKQPVTRGR
jgi:hypothetical protein